MPRAPWNERKAVSISVNPFSVSLRKPWVPLRTSPLKPFSGSFLPPSPCFRLSLLLTLEGHKVREEHHCHRTWFSLDVKQRSCNQPAVLWEIPVQELVPGTEFNFNGCWPSHLKAETCVGPVVEASHGQVNSAKNGKKWTLDYCTQTNWAPTGCQALCWALWILQSGYKPRHWCQMGLNLNPGSPGLPGWC